MIINATQKAPKFEMVVRDGESISDDKLQTYMSAFKLNESKPVFSIQETPIKISSRFKRVT